MCYHGIMNNNHLEKMKTVGNWLSAILLGNTRELIARIDERTERMVKDLDEMRPKLWDMSPKVDALWKDKLAPASSPRQLNEQGTIILAQSGIKEIVDEKKEQLTLLVKQLNPKTAYDAEQTILNVMNDLQIHCPDVVERLKEGAFRVGADIPTLLFVGSIYLRNQLFQELGFSIEDIDGTQT